MNKKRLHIDKQARPRLIKMALIALIVGIAGQQMLRFSSAASGTTLYLNPPSANVLQSASFDVKLLLDTAGQNVDGVQAYLTYPDSQLEFMGISEAGSAFGIGLPSSGGGGNITVQRVVNPDSSPTVTGPNLLVATVTMRARVGSGVASVDYTNQSRVTAPSAGNGSVLVNKIGGKYTLTSPPPSQPSTTSPYTPPAAGNTTTGSGTAAGSINSPKPPAITPNTSATVAPTLSTTQPTTSTLAQPNFVPIKTQTSGSSSARRNPWPLIAKIVGGMLIIASVGTVVKLLLTIKQHHLVPAAGGPSFGNSLGYQGDHSADQAEHPSIESEVFNSPTEASTPLVYDVKSPNQPEPGATINPSPDDTHKDY